MFNIDINSIQRVFGSAIAALVLSATCVGMAVAPASASETARTIAVLCA